MSGSRIFLGRLSYRATNEDVERFFRDYGHIRDVDVKRGYGFVELESARDADDAIHDLNGRELCGERVTVELARGSLRNGSRGFNGNRGNRGGYGGSRNAPREGRYGQPQRTKHRIVVENLSTRVTWQNLKDLMRKAGEITFADAHRAKEHVGVVEFASREDMKRAIEKFDDYELFGRRLKLREDTNDGKRGGDSDDSHSRSRSRSRSRNRGTRRSRSSSGKSRDKSPQVAKGGKRQKLSRSSSRGNSPIRSKDSSRSASPKATRGKEASPRSNGSHDGKRSNRSSRQSSVESRGSDADSRKK
jgi:arginine/serine-rich splicing factor 4/5/6